MLTVQGKLSCKKCGKKYHLESWLKKHEDVCNIQHSDKHCKRKTTTSTEEAHSVLNKEVVKLISDLNFDCYYEMTGLPALMFFLKELANTAEDVIRLRGERFGYAVHLSVVLLDAFTGLFEEGLKNRVESLIKSIGEEVWMCVFQGDVFKASSTKWGYSAQHMHHLRNDQEVKEAWIQVVKAILKRAGKPVVNDYLLLQKIISMFYSDISVYRCESSKIVVVSDKACPVLGVTQEEEAIIRYIGGFILKSIRNRFYRYIAKYKSSTTDNVKQKVHAKTQVVKLLMQMSADGVQSNTSDSRHLEYSKLLVESLNRGGLQIINASTYKLFLQIEFAIRPSLSLRHFLVSNTSDSNNLLR